MGEGRVSAGWGDEGWDVLFFSTVGNLKRRNTEIGRESNQAMQLMEDGEGGAPRGEIGMLEEAALGRKEGVPGCICGVGRCGAEEGIVVECAGCGFYCI